jgi:hypothetical protein
MLGAAGTAAYSRRVASVFSGKWIWVWNWRRCLGGDPTRVARRLHQVGCTGAVVKSDDGGHPFDQGRPICEIVHALQQEGLRAGCWGYVYGCDQPTAIYGDLKYTWAEEAAMAARFIGERPSPSYRGPDLYVVDVEAEYERQPADPVATAEHYLRALREAVGPDFPLAYASLPQPDYHRRLPYAVFQRHCQAVLPQAYHNAMDVSPERALALSYDAFTREGLLTLSIAPVGGAYGTVTPDELRRWAAEAMRRGALMLSWWSFEHIENERPELWDAIAAVPPPLAPDEEGEMIRWERRSRVGWAVDAPFAPGEYCANARADFEVPAEARSLLLYVEVRELSPADYGDAGRGGVDLYNGGPSTSSGQGVDGLADRLFTDGGEYRGRQVQVWLDGEGGYRLRVFGATIGLNVRCLAYGT